MRDIILPWQKTIWKSLLQRKEQSCLPHALLFSGGDGIGKKQFADVFANYLLCHSPEENQPCGHCRSCHLQKAKTHPDFMLVEPETGTQIKIDQIREIVSFVNHTPLLGGYRIIVLNPATAMNIYAANALLKTLEEPTANTLLILICQQSLRLPATIGSRCQKIIFPKPKREEALAWLANKVNQDQMEMLPLALNLADGAPLQAYNLIANNIFSLRRDLYDGLIQLSNQQADPLQFVTRWEDKDCKVILNLLLIWLRDLLKFKLTYSQAELINSDYQASIVQLAGKLASNNLLQYYDLIQKAYAQILNLMNVNRQLMFKEIFIQWAKL
ncbi:MAG TPA: DNA polymerase III subunit delta' [Gammaproteobacteria bacterium]|nr:DNA polymerase III subunit delta' [Gammaproteobacteria bacterium]